MGRLNNQTLQTQFTMAIISKLQLVLVCFLFSLLVEPSEAGRRGIFVVLFSSEAGPVWIGIGIAISVFIVSYCIYRCLLKYDKEENETRFQNQPMPAGTVQPLPFTIDNPVPHTTIDMNNQNSSSDVPPSYQQAINPYHHFGLTSSK